MAEYEPSLQEGGYVITAASEFGDLIIQQMEGGCSIRVVAAAFALCLDKGAKVDPEWRDLRITLARMLKEHADEE